MDQDGSRENQMSTKSDFSQMKWDDEMMRWRIEEWNGWMNEFMNKDEWKNERNDDEI